MEREEPRLLRVVRGEPTPEEIAAVVAVLTSYAAAEEPAARSVVAVWSDKRSALRRPLVAGPGAWQASGWTKGVRTRADW